MARQRIRNGVHVEWINVTYRSVGSVILGLVLLTAGGGSLWLYKYRIQPRKEAGAAIQRATGRLAEAAGVRVDERLGELLNNAKVHLSMARSEFAAADYREATVTAMQSEKLSNQLISLVGGQKATAERVRFSKIEGDVRVKQAGSFSWVGANTGMTLHVGDQVKTSSNASAEVIYFDGTVTRIQSGSLLEIRDLFEDPVTKVRRVKQKLTWGEVQASTQKRNVNGSYHEVATGKVAARSEEAGKFRIARDREQKSSVIDVFDGSIELTAPDRKERVDSGERVRATADGRLSAKQSLPGVPRLISPSDQRVFIFENPLEETFTLSWETLPGVPRYRLVISDKPLFTQPLYDAEREAASAVLDGVPAGTYHWRVAAISREGLVGPFSEARAFRVSSQRIRDRTDTEPPKLKIKEFVHIGQMVIINGQTEPGATLWVDNNKIDVYEDGGFNAVVRLRREGLNELVLMAQDTAGNEVTLKRSAYVETY